jgi:hypothetical protein
MTTNTEFPVDIPIFVSDKENIGMFSMTLDELVTNAIKCIEEYNTKGSYITEPKRKKLEQRQIEKIASNKIMIGNNPALLVNANLYSLNRRLIFKQENEEQEIQVNEKDRIGSNNNYFLLCPAFTNLNNDAYYWIVLVYDEPGKNTEDMIALAKSVMKNIIKQKVTNVKLKSVIEELKEEKLRVKLVLNSLTFNDNPINNKLESFQTSSKSFVKTEYEFNGVPVTDLVQNIIDDKIDSGLISKVVRFFRGDKEYKVSQELSKFKSSSQLLVEQHFNFTKNFPWSELGKINEHTFMMRLFNEALEKYLTNE